MSNRFTPMLAPEGMKWVISKTFLVRGRNQLLELGLWPISAKPNEWGMDTETGGRSAADSTSFWRRGQIRRASKRVLRKRETRVAQEANERRILGEVTGE